MDKLTENGITRSLQEITISARMNMQDMIGKAMALWRDFLEAKELLGHGKFLPWLEELGVSSSTANNYMRVAREIAPGSRMASLPYGKALTAGAVLMSLAVFVLFYPVLAGLPIPRGGILRSWLPTWPF